jgi:hypothetical protein
MWRGYGHGVHGHGVALVFDTSRLEFVETAPMFLLKVDYASSLDRLRRLDEMIRRWAVIVKQGNIADELLYVASFAAFRALIMFGLTQKHDGFSEEREWRAVYLPDADVHGSLRDRLSYDIGKQGVEPKLKFKLEARSVGDWPKQGMDTLLQRIILGPSVSSHLAKLAVERMLQTLEKQQFMERVVVSTIPLRPSHPGR